MSAPQQTLFLILLPPALTPSDVLAQLPLSNNTTSLPNPLHRGHHAVEFLDFLTYLGKRHSLHPVLTLPLVPRTTTVRCHKGTLSGFTL